MKRNKELIRLILLELESRDTEGWVDLAEESTLTNQGFTKEEIWYNSLLLGEAGLAEYQALHEGAVPVEEVILGNLTMQGHDVLDHIRDDSIWKKLGAKGLSLSFHVIGTATAQGVFRAMKGLLS